MAPDVLLILTWLLAIVLMPSRYAAKTWPRITPPSKPPPLPREIELKRWNAPKDCPFGVDLDMAPDRIDVVPSTSLPLYEKEVGEFALVLDDDRIIEISDHRDRFLIPLGEPRSEIGGFIEMARGRGFKILRVEKVQGGRQLEGWAAFRELPEGLHDDT